MGEPGVALCGVCSPGKEARAAFAKPFPDLPAQLRWTKPGVDPRPVWKLGGGKEMVSSYAYFIHKIVQGPNVMSPPPVKFLCWNPAPVGCTRRWGLWEVIRFR